jgi:hypothetical protein
VIRDSGQFAALLLFPGRVIEGQIRPAQADAVNLSMKPWVQQLANLVECESDTRRAAIDRKNARVSWFHG